MILTISHEQKIKLIMVARHNIDLVNESLYIKIVLNNNEQFFERLYKSGKPLRCASLEEILNKSGKDIRYFCDIRDFAFKMI